MSNIRLSINGKKTNNKENQFVHLESEEFNEFDETMKGFIEEIKRIQGFTNWMTNIGLASLAFFISTLISIRLSNRIFDKSLAIIGIISFVISIISGVYRRGKYEFAQSLVKLFGITPQLTWFVSRIEEKFIEKYGDTYKISDKQAEQLEKIKSADKEINTFITSIEKKSSDYAFPSIFQLSMLSLGFCCLFGCLFIFIFKE